MLEDIHGIKSSSELDNMFSGIKESLVDLENVDLRTKNGKQIIRSIVDKYGDYVKFGGDLPITDLTNNKSIQKKLLKGWELIGEVDKIDGEAKSLGNVEDAANSAADGKEKFI